MPEGVASTTGGSAPVSTPTSAPASTPAAPAADPASSDNAPAAAPSGDGVDNWLEVSDLGAEENSADGNQRPVAAPASAAAPATATQTPAAATPAAAAPVAAVAPVVAPVQPAAAQPAATPAVQETPEAKQAREQQEATTRKVAEEKRDKELLDFYKIPDDLAARLSTEPELVLPQLAVSMHKAMERNVLAMVQHMLPQHLTQALQATERETKAKDAFYTVHPHLKPYEGEVLKAGQLYRQMNPKATPEEAIKMIGTIVSQALGISASAPAAPAPAAAVAAAAAAAAKPAPFTPAGGAGSGRGPAPAAAIGNEFEAMVKDDDD